MKDTYHVLWTDEYGNKIIIDPFLIGQGLYNTYVDSRVLNEIPTLHEYFKRFHPNIVWCMVTGDTVGSNFPFQQSNQDFWELFNRRVHHQDIGVWLEDPH